MIDYQRLWEPYSADGHTIENTIRYLRKTAATFSVAPFLVDVAMDQVFQEVAQGKVFPKDKCPCGCGIDKAGTAIVHAMRDRMLKLSNETALAQAQFLETRANMNELQDSIDTMDNAVEAVKVTETKGIWQKVKDKWTGSR